MTRLAVPTVPRGLDRELRDFLNALRAAVGGDAATTTIAVQADVMGPVGVLTAPIDDLSPASAPHASNAVELVECDCDAVW